MIPVFVFEDHNEASLIWHYAVDKKVIPASNNSLLHVDKYSDDALEKNSLSQLYRFTSKEVTIANFIIPAIYRGIFNQFYWLHQPNLKLPTKSQSLCIYPSEVSDKCLIYKMFQKDDVKAQTRFKWLLNPKYNLTDIQYLTVNDDFIENQSVVLDVVLDYFLENTGGSTPQERLEITEEQYQAFIQDNNHYLRRQFGSEIETNVEHNKYYIVFTNSRENDEITKKRNLSDSEIIRRIEELIGFLQNNQVQLQLICLRRSRISGFGADENWELIEDYLLKRLGEVYDIQLTSIDKVLLEEDLNSDVMFSTRALVVSQTQATETHTKLDQLDQSIKENQITPTISLNTSVGRIAVYEDLVPRYLLKQIYNYYLNGLRWEFQNRGDEDDLLTSFWVPKDFPDSIYELREIVRRQLPYEAKDPRIVVNGHLFGLGDGIHRDSSNIKNPGQTAICYINPMWRADWDGETKLYSERDPSKADLIYACLPKPGRVLIFDGTIPHRGCPPSRLCNKLRITVAYQFPPPTEDSSESGFTQ
ncbi:UPF0489 family protein [Moorena producens]|uniref:UPF0489 family protein n=1 Tax=Moorena producens TaxID=1155739 RepID=UPI0009F39F71|nr:UPF0489 family protein [Moorena producens]